MAAIVPLIHVGYHKTGSSWLQEGIFCDESAGFCVPWASGREEAMKQFVHANPLDFAPTRARGAFEPELQAAGDRSLTPVISHEGLSGHPIEGRYYGCEVAKRLSSTFPEAKILICIREQKSMLLSLYRQYVKQYWGTASIDAFIESDDFGTPNYQPCRLHHFEYHRLIGMYQDLFGKKNVSVLPFELLRADSTTFVNRICDFVGRPPPAKMSWSAVNVSANGLEVVLRKRVNRYLPPAWRNAVGRCAIPMCRFAGRLSPRRANNWADERHSLFISRRVGGYFRASNERTAEITGLALSAYGYDCPA